MHPTRHGNGVRGNHHKNQHLHFAQGGKEEHFDEEGEEEDEKKEGEDMVHLAKDDEAAEEEQGRDVHQANLGDLGAPCQAAQQPCGMTRPQWLVTCGERSR